MDAVRAFNNELSSLYESKPPISRAKMAQITKSAIKAIKFYKHVVQSVEKFIQKCRQEYKIPGLYVVDSIVRQSRHQFGPDKEVFGPRFTKNIVATFQQLYKCTPEEKSKIIRVLNLWQKNDVFPASVVQPLLDLASDPSNIDLINKAQQAAESVCGQKASKDTDEKEEAGNATSTESNQQGDVVRLLSQLLQQSQQPQLQLSLSAQQQQLQQLQMLQQQLLQQARMLQDPQPQLSIIDTGMLQQIQSLMQQLVSMKARPDDSKPVQPSSQLVSQSASQPTSQPAFNKKLLDFDYDESDEEENSKMNLSSPTDNNFGGLLSNGSNIVTALKQLPEVQHELDDRISNQSLFKTEDRLTSQPLYKSDANSQSLYKSDTSSQSVYKAEINQSTNKTDDRFSNQPTFRTEERYGNQQGFRSDDRSNYQPVFKTEDRMPGQPVYKTDDRNLEQPVYKTDDHLLNQASYYSDDRMLTSQSSRYTEGSRLQRMDDQYSGISSNDEEQYRMKHVSASQFDRHPRTPPHEMMDDEPPLPENNSQSYSYFYEQQQQQMQQNRSVSPTRARSPRKRRRSRSRSRSRKHDRERSRRSRSHSKGRRKRSRSRSRSRERELERQKRERERERHGQGLPPIKEKHAAVCSTTLWIGHLKPITTEDCLTRELDKYGQVVSVNLIPPRGCAFVCFANRQNAHMALDRLRGTRLMGSILKAAWAPGKGIKESQFKDNWDVDLGVAYIPWDDLPDDIDQVLEGSVLDEESIPEILLQKRERLKEASNEESLQQPPTNSTPTSVMPPALPPGHGPMNVMPPMMMMPPIMMNAGLPPPPMANMALPPMGLGPPPFGFGQPPLPPNMMPLPAPLPQQGPVPQLPGQSVVGSGSAAAPLKENTQLAQAIQNIFSNSASIMAVAQNKQSSNDSTSGSLLSNQPMMTATMSISKMDSNPHVATSLHNGSLPFNYPLKFDPSKPPPIFDKNSADNSILANKNSRESSVNNEAKVIDSMISDSEDSALLQTRMHLSNERSSPTYPNAPNFLSGIGPPIPRPGLLPSFGGLDWRRPRIPIDQVRLPLMGPRSANDIIRGVRPPFDNRPEGVRLFRPQLNLESDMRSDLRPRLPSQREIEARVEKNLADLEMGRMLTRDRDSETAPRMDKDVLPPRLQGPTDASRLRMPFHPENSPVGEGDDVDMWTGPDRVRLPFGSRMRFGMPEHRPLFGPPRLDMPRDRFPPVPGNFRPRFRGEFRRWPDSPNRPRWQQSEIDNREEERKRLSGNNEKQWRKDNDSWNRESPKGGKEWNRGNNIPNNNEQISNFGKEPKESHSEGREKIEDHHVGKEIDNFKNNAKETDIKESGYKDNGDKGKDISSNDNKSKDDSKQNATSKEIMVNQVQNSNILNEDNK